MQPKNSNFNFYNKLLKPRANDLRHCMTKAEACLWKFVLRAKMTGYTFNRQRPVMNYIADFMCKVLKLIIEVDGITHIDESVIANDMIRQKALETAGFTVIRFTDEEVLQNIGEVENAIRNTIQELRARMR